MKKSALFLAVWSALCTSIPSSFAQESFEPPECRESSPFVDASSLTMQSFPQLLEGMPERGSCDVYSMTISGGGGDPALGLAFYDTVRDFENQSDMDTTKAKAIGVLGMPAIVAFLGTTDRTVAPNATFIFTQVIAVEESVLDGSPNRLPEVLDARFVSLFVHAISARTKLKPVQVLQYMERNAILGGDELVSLGFAQRIE